MMCLPGTIEKSKSTWTSPINERGYDFRQALLMPWRTEVADIMAEFLDRYRGLNNRVLDLGTGTGFLAHKILKRQPDLQLTGIDSSKAMLEIADKKLVGMNFTSLLMDFRDLKSLDYLKFCGAVSMHAIHHLDHFGKKEVIKNIFALLESPAPFLLCDRFRRKGESVKNTKTRREAAGIANRINAVLGLQKACGQVLQEMEKFESIEKDEPASIEEILLFTSQVGFRDVQVLWSHHEHHLLFGLKREA